MRIGYLECFSGISGDMLLGALVDAGVPFASLEATAAALNVGARLEMRKVSRGGLAATEVDVLTPEHRNDEHAHEVQSAHAHEGHTHEAHSHAEHSHEPHAAPAAHSHEHHRSLSAILAIIGSAPLDEPVKERASRAFRLLGEAEAAIHSIPIEKVHFHEVGAVDTIVDIVCAAAGCATLGVVRIVHEVVFLRGRATRVIADIVDKEVDIDPLGGLRTVDIDKFHLMAKLCQLLHQKEAILALTHPISVTYQVDFQRGSSDLLPFHRMAKKERKEEEKEKLLHV